MLRFFTWNVHSRLEEVEALVWEAKKISLDLTRSASAREIVLLTSNLPSSITLLLAGSRQNMWQVFQEDSEETHTFIIITMQFTTISIFASALAGLVLANLMADLQANPLTDVRVLYLVDWPFRCQLTRLYQVHQERRRVHNCWGLLQSCALQEQEVHIKSIQIRSPVMWFDNLSWREWSAILIQGLCSENDVTMPFSWIPTVVFCGQSGLLYRRYLDKLYTSIDKKKNWLINKDIYFRAIVLQAVKSLS